MADRDRSRSRSPARDESNGGDNYAQNDSGAEEVKLYVGNLDYDTNEEKIREAFGVFGTVTDVFLPTDRDSSRPRGFGFVTIAGRAAAEEAIAKMDQSQLDNRTIRVNESRPRGEGPSGGGGGGGFNASGQADVKLYVGNLAFDATKESVESIFSKYGEIKDCFLPTDRNTQQPRGFAFVTMAAADAERACELNGQEIDGRPLRVNEAQPKGMPGGRGGSGGGGRGGYGGGYGGGYDQGGYGGGGGGYQGYGDRGGYSGRGGYDDRGGYGGRGGYDDRGGYGGGGYGGRGGGGYDDRGGYGGGRGRGGGRYDQGGYDQGYGGGGGGYDQGYGGGGGGYGGYGGGYSGGGYDDRNGGGYSRY